MCVTCANWKHFTKADCGHWVKRQYLSTRFDEKNCALQCKGCNNFKQGDDVRFHKMINERWGKNTAANLLIKKDNKCKIDIILALKMPSFQ